MTGKYYVPWCFIDVLFKICGKVAQETILVFLFEYYVEDVFYDFLLLL